MFVSCFFLSPAPLSFLDKVGVLAVRSGLEDASPRLQQSFLNILNRALRDRLPRLQKMLEADKKFLPCVLQLLEHSSPVIRGKALLCVCLLAQLHISWFVSLFVCVGLRVCVCVCVCVLLAYNYSTVVY
jgi:uncharacterized membrane protein YbaN (DUF454 family)